MATTQATKNAITLKGSATIISEYLSKFIKISCPFALLVDLYDFTYFRCLGILFSFYSSDYGINSILFQRGIYPAETFESHQQYGLTILMSTDAKIKDFLRNVLKQTEGIYSN